MLPLMPQWSDKDHTGTVHTFFDEAARSSGLRKSELVLELMLDAISKEGAIVGDT